MAGEARREGSYRAARHIVSHQGHIVPQAYRDMRRDAEDVVPYKCLREPKAFPPWVGKVVPKGPDEGVAQTCLR